MRNILYYLLLAASLTACQQAENRNDAAALPQSFDFSKMHLKTISSVINPATRTTSTLYGDTSALSSLKMSDSARGGEKTLVFITWKQQEDARWFGARIPAGLQMIEVLKTNTGFKDQGQVVYQRYDEKGVAKNTDNNEQQNRVRFISSIKPAVMP